MVSMVTMGSVVWWYCPARSMTEVADQVGLSSWLSLVRQAHMTDSFNHLHNFTAFIPTNDAFKVHSLTHSLSLCLSVCLSVFAFTSGYSVSSLLYICCVF